MAAAVKTTPATSSQTTEKKKVEHTYGVLRDSWADRSTAKRI
jgi:hypothetical protein